jgi:dolichol-phosphate mannosyltransferase
MKISVVVPVYGCPEALETLHKRLTDTLLRLTEDYEIILVNDACPKNSWLGIEKLCQADKKVIGINLSRNFGQINATNAGIEYSTGDYVVLLDCDLQDPPEAIEQLYHQMEAGYDIVFVGRANRKDSMMAKTFSTILSWMGYRSTVLMIEGEERFEGKSSYNMRRKVNLAIDLITFQSNKPLLFFIKMGVTIGILAVLYIIYQLCVYFIVGNAPSGWMSLIAVVCLLGGIQLVSIGVIGIYIGNIFNETKNRKSYFIQEVLNGKKE